MTGLLSHDLLRGAAPTTHWCVLAHGILGTKANLRSIARKLVQRFSHWGALLVDLREHGDSRGRMPPHTVDAAARDIEELRQALAIVPSMLVGHSFGGKVILRDLALHAEPQVPGPHQAALAWPSRGRALVLDANPGTPPSDGSLTSTWQVLELVDSLEPQWPTRDAFVSTLKGRGLSDMMSGWLAMNLRPHDGAYELAIDTSRVRELLADYLRVDAWPTALQPPRAWSVDFMIGARSGNFPTHDLARLETARERGGRVDFTILPQAGHWVHVEEPAAVQARIEMAVDWVESMR